METSPDRSRSLERYDWMDVLPYELILRCLSLFSVKDLLRCRLVCKRWCFATKDDALWRSFALSGRIGSIGVGDDGTRVCSIVAPRWLSARPGCWEELCIDLFRTFPIRRSSAQLGDQSTGGSQHDGALTIVARGLEASSVDHPSQGIEQTLNDSRGSFWSSKGTALPNTNEHLVYKLVQPICVVTGVRLRPYRAYYQAGLPIYGSWHVQLHCGFGPSKSEMVYHSPIFDVDNTNDYQTFSLPPIMAIGGFVWVDLIGKCTKQPDDDLYYTVLQEVSIIGMPYGAIHPRTLRTSLLLSCIHDETFMHSIMGMQRRKPNAVTMNGDEDDDGGDAPDDRVQDHSTIMVEELDGDDDADVIDEEEEEEEMLWEEVLDGAFTGAKEQYHISLDDVPEIRRAAASFSQDGDEDALCARMDAILCEAGLAMVHEDDAVRRAVEEVREALAAGDVRRATNVVLDAPDHVERHLRTPRVFAWFVDAPPIADASTASEVTASFNGAAHVPRRFQLSFAHPCEGGGSAMAAALYYTSRVVAVKERLNYHESVHFVSLVLDGHLMAPIRYRMIFVHAMIDRGKIRCSEELGDLLLRHRWRDIALDVYARAHIPDKVLRCLMLSGRFGPFTEYVALFSTYHPPLVELVQEAHQSISLRHALEFSIALSDAELMEPQVILDVLGLDVPVEPGVLRQLLHRVVTDGEAPRGGPDESSSAHVDGSGDIAMEGAAESDAGSSDEEAGCILS